MAVIDISNGDNCTWTDSFFIGHSAGAGTGTVMTNKALESVNKIRSTVGHYLKKAIYRGL